MGCKGLSRSSARAVCDEASNMIGSKGLERVEKGGTNRILSRKEIVPNNLPIYHLSNR
jgi:hypothetical protein